MDLWTTSTFGKWFFGILDSGSPGPKIQSFPKTLPVSTAHGASGTSGTSCTSTSLSTQNERMKCRKYRKCVKSERRCKACEKTGATLALWARHSLRRHTHSVETSLCCKSCHSNAEDNVQKSFTKFRSRFLTQFDQMKDFLTEILTCETYHLQ